MARITSKLQVTAPRALAAQRLDLETRLRLFREATDRQRRRQQDARVPSADGDRGWSREELYDRDRSR